MDDIRNALITKATLGIEDHGVLVNYLTLDFGAVQQAFGGYVLGGLKMSAEANYAGAWLMQIFAVTGTTEWSHVVGRPVRARRDNDERIVAIGHIIDDVWFEPAVVFEQMKKEDA